METRHTNPSQSNLPDTPPAPPSINLITMFRLGLFQMGLGTMSILTLGVLNRVMIDELKVPALLAAGAIAMHQFVAPARLWFGQMSDARPVLGTHRTGYIWVGTVLFTIAAFLAVQVIWQINTSVVTAGWTLPTYGWIAVLGLVFAGYGLALSFGSTPFAALLVDISDEHERSKLVGVVWSMLMVGIVVGAILSSTILDRPEVCGADILTYDPTQTARAIDLTGLQRALNRLFLIVPAVVIGLSIVGTVGIEQKYSRYQSRSTVADREDNVTLKRAWQVLTANRQTGVFFSFLLIMTMGLFMQEAVMEPYGGEVFGMCVSETTQLNAFWGMGTLVGLGATGFLVVPRIGKLRTTRLGCCLASGCFGLMILAGFSQNPQFLQFALLLFGVAAGITTSGALSLMLDFTAAETAGTFIGAWGLSQALARASATVSGGAVLDLGRAFFPSAFGAYALVFALQAGFMLLAVQFLSRVNVKEFKENANTAIANILASDLD